MAKATRVLDRKIKRGELMAQLVIWRLPVADRNRPHGVKYRLWCGRAGETIVRYDNETDKGDHRDYGNREECYGFASPEQLVQDFAEDVERMKRIEIGVGSLKQGLSESVRVWRQAEAGERVTKATPRVDLESLSVLLSMLTPKWLQVLAAIAAQPGLSIPALASHLARDYENVHGDVSALAELGLIERSAEGLLSAPYDELVIRAPLRAAA